VQGLLPRGRGFLTARQPLNPRTERAAAQKMLRQLSPLKALLLYPYSRGSVIIASSSKTSQQINHQIDLPALASCLILCPNPDSRYQLGDSQVSSHQICSKTRGQPLYRPLIARLDRSTAGSLPEAQPQHHSKRSGRPSHGDGSKISDEASGLRAPPPVAVAATGKATTGSTTQTYPPE
jgi:hypothetical protein